ncbi:MAG: hypothetical protein IJY58_03485 [Alphaproteobacteria bacterium]|nr:hypothetical protein [Alphaproteobacteria bacterium]
MLKLIWVTFWLILILAAFTLLVGFFSNDSVAQKCSQSLSDCLTKTSEYDGWRKYIQGINCLGLNAVCIVQQIKEVF